MKRITTATKVADLFGAGKDGFTDGSTGNGVAPTQLNAQFFNDVQEELVGIIEDAGLTPTEGVRNQIRTALDARYLKIANAPIGVAGLVRNAKMSVAAASATATLTADECVVKAALGGASYILSSINKTINLATTGAGGMDTGTAPISGAVGVYLFYNPTTQASCLIGQNATAAVLPAVYGGAYAPAGYTTSALVSVWPTNAIGQFVVGNQNDRKISIIPASILTTSTLATSPTSFTFSGVVPLNGKSISGYINVTASGGSLALGATISASSSLVGAVIVQGGTNPASFTQACAPYSIDLTTPQTAYYGFVCTSGSGQLLSIVVSSYTF